MLISGKWVNELGSTIEITLSPDGVTLEGKYHQRGPVKIN
jgi:Avidin family